MRKAVSQMPSSRPAAKQSPQTAAILVCLVLAAATFLVFWPVQGYDFVNYDDPEYVSENRMIAGGLTAESISWALRSSDAANWHPLTWLSHMVDVELFGMNPGGHHLTNVVLHSVSAMLLFLCLRALTGALWRSAIVAAVFALHPLRIESVAWISERKDVLSMMFGLLSVLAYANYARCDFGQGIKRVWYILALLFFAIGLTAKPMLVTLPFLLLLLDYWPLRRIHSPEGGGKTGSLLIEKVPFLLLTFASCAVTFFVQQKGGAVEELGKLPLDSRIANALVSYPRYIGKLFWPSELTVLYPPRTWPVAIVAGAALVLLSLTAIAIVNFRKRPYLIVGWLWFVGTLVPVIGIVQVGLQSMADRYTYLSTIGLLICIIWLAHEWVISRRIPLYIPRLGAAAILCGCIVTTRAQLPFWKNSETLFQRAIAVTENNHIAWNNYARALPLSRSDESMRAVEKALQIDPNYVDALNNLANELASRGRRDEALAHYKKALELDPKHVLAHNNLGVALAGIGRIDEAIAHYETAIRLKPDYASAINNLGLALAAQGKSDAAIEQFRYALKWDSKYIDARNNLANTLVAIGQYDAAITEYLHVLRADPNRSDTCNRLGIAFATKGDLANAVKNFGEAVRLDGNHMSARNNLARALAQQGRPNDALSEYSAALAIESDNADTRINLATLLVESGRPGEALEHYSALLKNAPDDPTLHFRYGLALQQSGQGDSAGVQFREALRLKPDYAEPRAQLEALATVSSRK
jgi:tetratricopeptide (TPR) repeat protein